MDKSRHKIKQLFSDRKFRYGGSSALFTVLVIAIVVLINLIVRSYDLRLDLTANKMYSLSEQTLQILDNLDRDVNIYALYRTGNETKSVSEIIQRYVRRSDHISFEYVDPLLNPQFVEAYQGDVTPDLGSVIVESGDRFRVIQPMDFFNYTYNYYYQLVPESLAIEQQITSAIMYVTAEQLPVVYRIIGHGELELPESFADLAKRENFQIEDLDLLTVDAVPEDAGVLLLASPQKDLSAEEDEKLRAYLEQGGRLVMMVDFGTADRPVLEGLLDSYGLRLEKRLIIEGDAGARLSNPFYLVPRYQSHVLTEPMERAKSLVVMPLAQPITILQARRSKLNIEPLLTTSTNSWAKADFEAQTLNWVDGDAIGPFNVAVAVTDGVDDGWSPTPAKLVVISSRILVDQFDQLSRGANSELIINSINWLIDAQENIMIRPKPLTTARLSMTYLQQLILSGIFVIVLPVLVFLTGFIVWTRRRHL